VSDSEALEMRGPVSAGALEARLEAAELRSKLLLELAWDAVTVLDESDTVIEASPSWQRILGVAPQLLIGRRFSDFEYADFSDEALARYGTTMDRAVGSGRVVALNGRGGRPVFLELSNRRFFHEGRQLTLSIGRDITDRVEALRNLEASEQKYRSLVESVPDIVSSRNRAGDLVFVSPNVEAISGFSVAEVMANRDGVWKESVHPDDLPQLLAARAAAFQTRTPFEMEYRFRHRDGRWLWFRTRSAVVERKGELYLDSIISDVTARRMLEAQMVQAQKMEALGQLTGGVAHDFNNILTAILVGAHFLLRDLAPDDPRREDADEIRKGAERAAGLTRQLLAFSRKQVLQPRRLDLNAVIGGVEKMLRRLIGEDIALRVELDHHIGPVIADPGQLEQVIMNLVVNARDAMPKGGTLVLQTHFAPRDKPTPSGVELKGNGPWSVLSIRDTGCGMDEATQRRIFEPFFTTKGNGKGTGLGLSTCYGIVAQSGGFIAVESSPGHGTTFSVHLPAAVGVEEAPASGAAAEPAEAPPQETLLLIEDDDRARLLVWRILKEKGYRVLVARDPVEAENLVQQHSGALDLILTDVVMPQGNGPDCVRRVRKIRPVSRALYMSGYTDHPALHADALAGNLDFIQKPFSPEALARKIREVLDR
jgi:two-component system, cell cycle sensor histidine kinase and response regulator CckA